MAGLLQRLAIHQGSPGFGAGAASVKAVQALEDGNHGTDAGGDADGEQCSGATIAEPSLSATIPATFAGAPYLIGSADLIGSEIIASVSISVPYLVRQAILIVLDDHCMPATYNHSITCGQSIATHRCTVRTLDPVSAAPLCVSITEPYFVRHAV
jgi:hypothetical protein